MRAILMFDYLWEAKSQDCPQTTTFEEKGERKRRILEVNTTTAFMNYTANFGSEYNHSFYELYSGSYDGLEQGRPEFQPVVTLSHHDILILCYTCMTSTPTHQNKW